MPVKVIVDLTKIVENAKTVKKLLPKETKLCAVVKADAYGHGAAEVSNALYNYVDCFAVATGEEAIELRYSGIDKPVLVLTKTLKQEAELAIRHGISLTAESIDDLILYKKSAEHLRLKAKIHLKYDTGMRRQGFRSLKELERALVFCSNSKNLVLEGLYTHYAAPENEVSLERATDEFLLAVKIAKRYNKNVICHASASGGLLCGKFFDMVRVGILLYGYKPFLTDKISVSPAMKVLAPIVNRRVLKKGDHALYGEKTADKDENICLVRYGYADGLMRKETEGQFNNRCMDVTALTDVKTENGYAVIMDDADALSAKYGTISYEILVKCALRAQKCYLR